MSLTWTGLAGSVNVSCFWYLQAPYKTAAQIILLRRPDVPSLLVSSCSSYFWCVPRPAGHNEGTIAVAEGELLYVIEEDKGDGWTRVRRNEDEEGYVPTSYVEVFLETNAKGAMTYI